MQQTPTQHSDAKIDQLYTVLTHVYRGIPIPAGLLHPPVRECLEDTHAVWDAWTNLAALFPQIECEWDADGPSGSRVLWTRHARTRRIVKTLVDREAIRIRVADRASIADPPSFAYIIAEELRAPLAIRDRESGCLYFTYDDVIGHNNPCPLPDPSGFVPLGRSDVFYGRFLERARRYFPFWVQCIQPCDGVIPATQMPPEHVVSTKQESACRIRLSVDALTGDVDFSGTKARINPQRQQFKLLLYFAEHPRLPTSNGDLHLLPLFKGTDIDAPRKAVQRLQNELRKSKLSHLADLIIRASGGWMLELTSDEVRIAR